MVKAAKPTVQEEEKAHILLDMLAHLLRSPVSEVQLPADLETELLLKGAVVTLQQESSEESIHILKDTCVDCPLESIREVSLVAIDALASEGNSPAIQALFELAIERDYLPARDVITHRGYTHPRPVRQVIFDLLSGQIDQFTHLDPNYGQLTAFFRNEAGTDLQQRLISAAGRAGLSNWITIIGAAQDPDGENTQALIDRYPAFQPHERKLALRLLSELAAEKQAQAREALCELFIRYEDNGAKETATLNGYAPQDPVRRALFLFLSEQWKAYETFDFDHRLLATAYAAADNTQRKRILDLSRKSGQMEWFGNLSGTNRMRWLRDLSDADWETTIQALTGAERWAELWRLSQLSAPVWSARMLQALSGSGWKPASGEEQDELEALVSLAADALVSPLTIRPFRTFNVPSIDDITAMAISPDGKVIALGSSSNAVHLWRIENTPEPLPVLYAPVAQSRALAFSPDGEYLVSGVGNNTIHVYRWRDGKEVKSLEGHEGLVRSLAISPDGRALYSASFDGTLRSWRFPYGPEVKVIARSEGEIFGLAMSPDGSMLISGGADRVLEVYQLPEGNKVGELAGHEATVTNLAAAPTTQFVASYSRDRTIRVWNFTSGREIETINYGQDVVTGLCIHPNEQVLISAGYRGPIHLWSMSTGKVLYELSHHKRAVIGLALTPEGDRLVSASADGTVTIWNLEIFLQSRQPVETVKPERANEIQKMVNDKSLSVQEKKWMELTLQLLRWKQRFDVEIEGQHTISVGEFDIQI